MNKRLKKKLQKNNQTNEITLQQAVDKIIDEQQKNGISVIFIGFHDYIDGKAYYKAENADNSFVVIGSKGYK